ncbi:hypothetical protein EPA93_41060 [Ktedonosporobacter rubrisoli]|uniref:O-antigen ligase-related domain-containing protein n=1 Tax=Ktedonosporobacter rubrisoli TaxID=2509675 RepID=A0A4V0Z054_KTERU|nr:O-antigen ligase family protein [Ktedonosporobacter rubrisoli]QBD82031.1 hypothetical protein EPA93_41060 [Ktedonosporobacter rubrisoli]
MSVRRIEFGLLILAIASTPFVPTAVKLDWFYVSPAIPLLFLLLFVGLVHISFRDKKVIFPPFQAIWPLLGLFAMACISEIASISAWPDYLQTEVHRAPILVDELVGIVEFSLPILIVFVVSVALSQRDKWITYILHANFFIAIIAAGLILFRYRSIGADVYAFRYASPSIYWMPLEALAQILGLGCIIGYAHTLCAPTWRKRIWYAIPTGLCLLSLYLSLENSWWLEVGLAFVVITAAYQLRLFLWYGLAGVPILPLIPTFLAKLQSLKQDDLNRLIIWQDMFRIWGKRPLLGVGPGNVWVYDKISSHLPQGLRDIDKSGLGVAHEGFIQTLTELGPIGLFFQLSFIVVMAITSLNLFRRSKETGNHLDSILGLVGLGLICGGAAGDITSSYFFLPPRQALHVVNVPMVMMHWIIYGCVIYRSQIWRLVRKGVLNSNGE